MKDIVMGEPRKQTYRRIVASLRTERSSFEPIWREIATFVKPGRARFLQSDNNRGDRRWNKIINSAASLASRTLAAGMMAGVTSPARKWFRLSTPDDQLSEYGPVKVWMDDVRDRILAVFARSNWYNKLPTLYSDMGNFGTGAMAILEDDRDFIRCYDYPIGSYMLGTDSRGKVAVFAREYTLTVRQTVQRFVKVSRGGTADWSTVSSVVRQAWERGQYLDKVLIQSLVMDNVNYDDTRIDSKFKQFISVHYEVGASAGPEIFLEEKGFDEFPVIAPRWEVTGEDAYGTEAPGWMALGDIKMLQQGEKHSLMAVEKGVKPPLVGSIEMRSAAISMIPAEVTYVDESTDRKLRPLHDVNLAINQLEEKLQQVQHRIDRCYFADLFLMLEQLDRSQITATEIMERKQEKLLILGPTLEQLNQDGLDPAVERAFRVLDRRGELPPPPPELHGQTLRVEYESIMAQAQKEQGLGALDRFATFTLNMAKMTGDTRALDKWDMDQTIDEYGLMTNVPSRIVRPDDAVKELRAERDKQQQAAQAAATAKDQAAAAQTLSKTDTSGKNALTDILKSGQSQSPLGNAPQGEIPASLDGALA